MFSLRCFILVLFYCPLLLFRVSNKNYTTVLLCRFLLFGFWLLVFGCWFLVVVVAVVVVAVVDSFVSSCRAGTCSG